MELVFLQGAQAEVQLAFERYGGPTTKRAGLTLQRLDKAMGLLCAHPEMAPIYAGRFRRFVLRGFSHAVF